MKDVHSVSVIIPVYNAAAYLERCVQSLFDQSLKDIEYVFVDDCSTDESITTLNNMLAKYPDKHGNVKIIKHAVNQGVSASRNTGLMNATGEYVGWVDADDYVDIFMFEKLFMKTKHSDADLVWCNYFNISSHAEKVEVKQIMAEDPRLFAKALILNITQGSICNKLIKRSIFFENKLQFLEGQDVAEDFGMLFKILHLSRKIVFLDEALYYYCHNNRESISKQVCSSRIYQGVVNAQEMLNFIKNRKIQDYTTEELDKFKYLSKRKFLNSLRIQDFQAWRDVFPETNYLTKLNLLACRHNTLANLAVAKRWRIIKFLVFIKKIKSRFSL